jgi:hypothetical protein
MKRRKSSELFFGPLTLGAVFTGLVALIALNSYNAAFAGGGAEAGNGGGIAEKNILYAYLNFDSYLDLCLRTRLCRLTSQESKLLGEIRESLPREKASPSQIVFRSEKVAPGFFLIQGQVRVARTGDEVGNPIYVNSDLLYTELDNHQFKAVDVPMAISILTHEFGHHHGAKDHQALDLLGSKLQSFFLLQSQRAELWNGQIVLHTFQFNVVTRDEDKDDLRHVDQVVLSYRDALTNLTPEILTKVHCLDLKTPTDTPVLGLRIYNLHEERGVQWDAKTQLIRKPLEAWYILSCQPGAESEHGNLRFVLTFRKATKAGEPVFLPDQTAITQISCKDDSRVCK